MKQHLAMLATALIAGGCAQFTTSGTERGQLEAGARAAGDAYVACLASEARRYAGTSRDVAAVTGVARGNCTTARDAAARAQASLQESQYILSAPEVEAALKDLDKRGDAEIARLVLDPATPVAAPAPAAAAPAAGSTTTTPAPYLDCMREQASRWADVAEPATVIADAAHGRCAGRLAGVAGADALEREGRAVVAGIVLDRKAGR